MILLQNLHAGSSAIAHHIHHLASYIFLYNFCYTTNFCPQIQITNATLAFSYTKSPNYYNQKCASLYVTCNEKCLQGTMLTADCYSMGICLYDLYRLLNKSFMLD